MFGVLLLVGFVGVYLWQLVAVAAVVALVWCVRRAVLRERAAADVRRREIEAVAARAINALLTRDCGQKVVTGPSDVGSPVSQAVA